MSFNETQQFLNPFLSSSFKFHFVSESQMEPISVKIESPGRVTTT